MLIIQLYSWSQYVTCVHKDVSDALPSLHNRPHCKGVTTATLGISVPLYLSSFKDIFLTDKIKWMYFWNIFIVFNIPHVKGFMNFYSM